MLGISRWSLSERIRKEPLISMLRSARDAAYEAASSAIADVLVEAVATLAELMRASSMKDSVRFTAAKSIISAATRMRDAEIKTAPTRSATWFDLPEYVPAVTDSVGHADPRIEVVP